MKEAVSDVLALRADGPGDLGRLMSWSMGIHLGVTILVLGWQAWRAHSPADDVVMTISLSGAFGPTNSGTTPIGGKQVDQVAPAPTRPDPPAPPRPADMSLPARPSVKPVVPAPSTVAPAASVVRPATGREVGSGSSVVETGGRGESAGLSTGGGTGARVDTDFEFCCREYLTLMEREINSRVTWKQENHGTVVLKFEVQRSGAIERASVVIQKSSGSAELDQNAMFAVRNARLQQLPAEYTAKSLLVVLTVPY